MGDIVENYDALARVVLQALVNSFWPGLILLVLAWLALRLIGRTSATTRHAIWVVCLCAIAALPFRPAPKSAALNSRSPLAPPIEQFEPSLHPLDARMADIRVARIAVPENQASTGRQRHVSFAEPPRSSEGLRGQEVPGRPHSAVTSASMTETRATSQPGAISRAIGNILSGRVPAILIGIWLLVASILSARIAWSYVFLFRIRRRLGLVPSAHRERGRNLAEIFGIRRRVRIFTSLLVGAPMTIGWLRPLVILPTDLLRTLGEEDLNSILAHELAHIKRWDYLTNLAQRLAQALLFFHPAVWVIGSQLSLERELACDDWAIKLTGQPRRYAKCLTRMVETMSGARSFAGATGMIFGKHVISRRIEMILNRERNSTTSVSKVTLYSAISSAALVVVLATFISPAIAIPLAPSIDLARSQGPRAQAPRSEVPVVAPSEGTAPMAPAPPLAARLEPTKPTELLAAELPLLPLAPDEPVFELLETMPTTAIEPARLMTPMAPPLPRSVSYRPARVGLLRSDGLGSDGFAPIAVRDPFVQTPPSPPSPPLAPAAPRVRTATTMGFDERNSQPAIPEAELLTVLTDVVKRDADPNVRAEALRGIYRFRSDAAVAALLSLYDTIPDVKTKGDVLSYVMRSEGDNSKAIAKLLQIARTEKDETLRSRALGQLAKVKGDEGANHLIAIYDSLQDPKEKQTVIRYLGYNKSRKAADKLIQIAKNDTDPAVRQSAIRSLYAIDNRLYLNLRESGFGPANKISEALQLNDLARLRFELDREAVVIDREAIERGMSEARRTMEEMQQQFRLLPEIKAIPQPKATTRIR